MDYLKIGYIRKPHGLKGEVKVLPLISDPERYKKLRSVFLLINNNYIEEEVENARGSSGEVILKFKKFNRIEDVEALRSIYIFVSREKAEKLSKGEFYSQDIIGCEFVYKENTIGTVKDVINHGSCDIFVVTYNGREIMYPFLNEYIDDIDIKNKKIFVNQFEGFFD
jgi:16S rRNA processing protein RimM